ncbi:MAG: WYL domain-containing protein [Paludibacter sp.]
MDQPKVERLLRLMQILTDNNSFSVSQISSKLKMSVRTIYRYIDTFREAGFVIKKEGQFIRLDRTSSYFKDISQLVHFTEEESYILKCAIESIDENNLMKQNLKKKLYTVYDYKILTETIVSRKIAQNVEALVFAIQNNQQVILRNYSSAHGKDIRDRVVEPFEFTTNYVQVWCFCAEERMNKLFKVSRIGIVDVLEEKWNDQNNHQSGYIDIFRLNSKQVFPLKLKMGLRSASLLTEEYPLAHRDIKKISDNEWLLDTKVCTYNGVARFVMGLIEDIEIVDSPDFKAFILERIKRINKKMGVE